MTAAELDRYRQSLLALGRRLRGEERELSGEALRPSGPPSGGNVMNTVGDAGDVSVDAASQDVSISLMANERELLAQVNAALERIEQGAYGKCVTCGKPIARERLDALPYTPYCVNDARQAVGA